GNTTDLRILSALIIYFKERGYNNILIGEGTNSGFYRCKIGVISRLKIDALAKHHGVRVMDFNYARPYEIEFENGVKAAVAKETVEAELFINLPKLKTHFENGMTACLKNLMGCLIGQENKKKTHDNLAANIININKQVRPHLHIIDSIIGMEGLGPTKGLPIRLNTLLVGTDPFLLDLAGAELAAFDYRQVRTLALAEKLGIINESHHSFIEAQGIGKIQKKFLPPDGGPLASFIHSPKRQKFFLKIRHTKFFTYLASTKWFGHLLFLTNLRQDVFIEDELHTEDLLLAQDKCDNCGKCAGYCPMGLPLPEAFQEAEQMNECIGCLYCFCVCPHRAIEHRGKLGFMAEQLVQYDEIIRKIS
ncbi:MAG: DUF362 domain-containing protein, partial [Candidatus Electrothrix sp. MAN1_4]|nr:DUF362 domain-containing protein [Candidatus Electrothrix sp. MAN1_4]